MAAKRYWRLHISATGGAPYVIITELRMAESAGGVNVCTGGTASASSIWAEIHSAEKAFDGSLVREDSWYSASGAMNGGGSSWLQYDFGATPRDITEISISFNGGAWEPNAYPVSFLLYSSHDGVVWNRQRAWSGQVFEIGETKVLDASPLYVAAYNRNVLDKRFRNNSSAQSQAAINFNVTRFSSLFAGGNYVTPIRLTPYSGRKRITGSTTALGIPVARTVHLYDQKRGQLIASVFTKSDGVFQFADLAEGAYTVMGVDSGGEQNSVVYANVVAVD